MEKSIGTQGSQRVKKGIRINTLLQNNQYFKSVNFLQPYGVNQPGPVIRYQTTDLNGHPQKGTGKAAKNRYHGA